MRTTLFMFPSIFTDELGLDVTEALPIIKSWGLNHADFRSRIFGKTIETLSNDEIRSLKQLLSDLGLKTGCFQTSLAKVHLPDDARCQKEAEKLEGIIRAADALDCSLVRAFFYWQPPKDLAGQLSIRPDLQQKVLDLFSPLADRAKQAGLILAFENCGVTTDEVLTMLNLFRVPQWGLAWDVSNGWDTDSRQMNEDAYIYSLVRHTKLVHVKAIGAVKGLWKFDIPYEKVLQQCASAGVQGPVSAETHNPSRDITNIEMSHETVEAIQKAWPTAAPAALVDPAKSTIPPVTRPWHDDPVGFVVVGLGMGHNRAIQITKTSGCKLIGVCDGRPERAKRTGETCGVPYTTDLQSCLANPEVEVIYIVTETGRHAEIARQAFAARKHVLSTKPMEASLEACDEMIRLAEERNLLLGVDFENRFTIETAEIRAAVATGRFGKLLSGACSLKIQRTMDYFRSSGGWRGTRRWDGGGVLSNQAIHYLDQLAYAIGIPSKVRCDIWTQTHEIGAEDLGSALWLYDSGLVIAFTATSSYPHPTWYTHLELEGTDGAYSHRSGGPNRKAQYLWYMEGAWSDISPVPAQPQWMNATDNFAAAVRGQAELVCPGRDGRRSQSILDAMYRSAYENAGNWVEVKPEID